MKEMVYYDQKDGTYEVLHKGTYKGYNYAIISYKTHPCCYIRIPKDNIYYKKSILDISFNKNLNLYLDVHGGITFANAFDPTTRQSDPNIWWIGWDYDHYGDRRGNMEGDEYTTKEMYNECRNCINQIIHKTLWRIYNVSYIR